MLIIVFCIRLIKLIMISQIIQRNNKWISILMRIIIQTNLEFRIYNLQFRKHMAETEQKIQDDYKAGPIDDMIVSTLQSMDRGSF